MRDRLTDEQRATVEANVRLAVWVADGAKNYWRPWLERDDVISTLYLLLMRCVQKFDPLKRVELSTYFVKSAKLKIKTLVQNAATHRARWPVSPSDSPADRLCETEADDDDIRHAREVIEAVRREAALTNRQREIIESILRHDGSRSAASKADGSYPSLYDCIYRAVKYRAKRNKKLVRMAKGD